MRKLLGFAFLGGLIFGVIETWNWIRHRNPVEVTFVSNEISELPKHVTLKGIFLSPGDVASTSGLGGKQLYIPIRAMDDNTPAKTLHFVLKSNDADLVASLEKAGSSGSAGDALMALRPVLAKREISGMVDTSALTRKQRGELREQFPILAEDFAVIEEGRRPSLFSALFLFGFGALALFISGRIYPDAAAPEPPVQAPAPAATSLEPPPVIRADLAPPVLPVSPSSTLTADRNGKPEHVDASDPVTAGIAGIKLGNQEQLPGWIQTFAKAKVFVVSAESLQARTAYVFGPEHNRNYLPAFTRLELAQACLQQMPQLKYAISLKGLELLQLAQTQGKGIWLNPLSEASTLKFPADKVATLVEQARRS